MEDQGETLREPSAFRQSHGFNLTTTQSLKTDIGNKKALSLRSILENDLQAADVKWSLFVAACQSYRYDSCLKPFPPQFIMSPQVIDLLYWVLVHLKDVRMQSVPKSEFDSVMECVHCETAASPPNLIFQLNSLFGHGIYLSSELSVSLPYSPMGYSWGRSVVGSEMSCVALCEVINHPDVKCQDKESSKSRSIAKDSIGGEVPQKYYVVMNSDLVKVRYLLVYSKCTQRADSVANGSWLGWVGRHKLLTLILGYVLLLASVGLSNNRAVQRYYLLMLKKVGL
ncbi:Mono [ADP-ribose] polymerase PARP16 [Blattella germanica]|nr:Mono [ADP-ribose] polymerase PARP16 [Blattella germanica]